MIASRLLAAVALALALVAPALAVAAGRSAARPDASSPTALIQSIYRLYTKGATPDVMAPPLDAATFEPGLVKLLRQAHDVETDDPIGFFDHDFFCLCQDYSGALRATVTLAPSRGAGARAVARFANGGVRGEVRFTLARGPTGWRISDMQGSDGSSLRADLAYIKANTAARADHRRR